MRARNIKPGFFKNDCLGSLSIYARYLFAGLWCLADREGRLEDRPQRIKAEVFPYDGVEVEELLEELARENGDHPFILRYEMQGRKYIQVLNFKKHQKPHRNEKPSVIPPPPEEALKKGEGEWEKRADPPGPGEVKEPDPPGPGEVKEPDPPGPGEVKEPDPGPSREGPKAYPKREEAVPWWPLGREGEAPGTYPERNVALPPRADSPILRFPDSPDSPRGASPEGEAQEALRPPFPPEELGRALKAFPLKEASGGIPPEGEFPGPPPSSPPSGAEKSGPPGLSRQAESGPPGFPRQAEVGPPGFPRQAEVGPPGFSPQAESGPPGFSPPEESGPPGFPPQAESGPPGLSPQEEVGPPGLSRQEEKASPSPRSPSLSRKVRTSPRSPPSPAVEAYKKAFFIYPRRNLFPLIEETVGSDEESLRQWFQACQSWAAHGWNPKNIAGLLEYFKKRGFEEKSSIPKFSREAQKAMALAEKLEREERDVRENELQDGKDREFTSFFQALSPSRGNPPLEELSREKA